VGSIAIARSILRLRPTMLDNSPKPKSRVAWEGLGIRRRFPARFVVSDCLSSSEHSHAASHTVLHLMMSSLRSHSTNTRWPRRTRMARAICSVAMFLATGTTCSGVTNQCDGTARHHLSPATLDVQQESCSRLARGRTSSGQSIIRGFIKKRNEGQRATKSNSRGKYSMFCTCS
jgi:hypothetical protein